MNIKTLFGILIVLVITLFVLLGFALSGLLEDKEQLKEEQEKEETYSVEEVVEQDIEDLIPAEDEPMPAIEESKEYVETLNEVTIEIRSLRFHPDEVTISPGTTIVWTNKDNAPHKVVAYDRLFYGPRLQPGDSYSFTFTKPGVHRYFDAVFVKIGRGKIIVEEEPLPITGSVIGFVSGGEDSVFALLVIMFFILVFSISHIVYNHHRI